MDWYPILFDAQLALIVIALVVWAFDDEIAAWERRVIRRIRRRKKSGVRCTDGKVVGCAIPTAQPGRGREG